MDTSRDIWEDFKPLIKRLYEGEKRTLKEVKAVLEGQHGFPAAPLSVYETKLRNKLCLQKNLRRGDWCRIFHYARAHGLGEFDIILNGTTLPSKKIRKAFSRYGVGRSAQPVGPVTALPDGVEIRKRSASDSRQTSATTMDLEPLIEAQAPVLDPSHALPVAFQDEAMPLEPFTHDVSDNMTSLVPAFAPRLSPTLQYLDWQDLWLPDSFEDLSSWLPALSPRNSGALLPSPTLPHTNVLDTHHDLTSLVPRSRSPSINTAPRGPTGNDQSARAHALYYRARSSLETIPWNQYRLELQAKRYGKSQAQLEVQLTDHGLLTLMPADGFFKDIQDGQLVPVSETRYPMIDDLSRSDTSSMALSPNFDPYHFLAEIVYLISNNLYDKNDNKDVMINLLESLTHRIRRTTLFDIFRSSTPSIRAVWEKLFDVALEKRVRSTFALLISIALELHPDWINEGNRGKLLHAALSTGQVPLLQELLDVSGPLSFWDKLSKRTVFGVAASYGATSCARLLTKHFELNSTFLEAPHGRCDFGLYHWSIFLVFIFEVGEALGQTKRVRRHHSKDRADSAAYLEILKILLEAGADVDIVIPYAAVDDSDSGWDITCLDLGAYLHPSIFDLMLPHGHVTETQLTRRGVGAALAQGSDALTGYLCSVSAPPNVTMRQCLEAMIGDQFLVNDWRSQVLPQSPIEFHSARAIVEYGILMGAWGDDWILVTNSLPRSHALELVVKAAVCCGMSDDLAFWMDHLIPRGGLMPSECEQILLICMERKGAELLEALFQHGALARLCDEEVLFSAARQHNYEAMSLMLSRGVDINSEICMENRTMTILGHMLTKPPYPPSGPQSQSEVRTSLLKLWTFLIDKGASLRLRREDPTCHQLLLEFAWMVKGFLREAFKVMALEFILQCRSECNRLSPLQCKDVLLMLLDGCPPDTALDWRTAETLFRRCHPISEPILAAFIRLGCDAQFVEELLGAGQGINDYSRDRTPLQAAAERLDLALVSRLLALGADVNTPGTGEEGHTALQLVCKQGTSSAILRDRQWRLVRLLVDAHADVNAPVYGWNGSTALQLVCDRYSRSREDADHLCRLTKYLIEVGADVNARPGIAKGSSLGSCAEQGDLEKVVILVQNGADPNKYPSTSSLYSGDRPWKSALDVAAERGRLDVTQYLLDNEALSAIPGTTGYQGAIDRAEERCHDAVKQLICSHTEKIMERQLEDPDVSAAHARRVARQSVIVQRREQERWQWMLGYRHC